MTELRHIPKEPMKLHYDNQASIHISFNSVLYEGIKQNRLKNLQPN